MEGFPCHGCGMCCRQMSAVLAVCSALPTGTVLGDAAAAFPYAVDEAGACSQLQDDNTCGVYDSRPDLCSVDRMFELLHPAMSRADWYAVNAAACPPPDVIPR
jgi:Fe-S-cluster containining protein